MKLGNVFINTKNQDEKILHKIQEQDKKAFIKAYDLYVDEIYRFVYFKIKNKNDVEDLTSTIFLKTWNYIIANTIKDTASLRALFYQIARTSIIDYYRKNSNKENLTINNEKDIPDIKQNIVKDIEVKEEYKVVMEKLKELKEKYQEIIIWRFVNELNISEIAKIINKSEGNTRVLVHRALNALKKICKTKT